MGYGHAGLLGRLKRIETRLETEGLIANCSACFGGHRLEMVFKGDQPRGCPVCGTIGSLVLIEAPVDADGRRLYERADMLV